MRLSFVRSRAPDIAQIAGDVREADKTEILASSGEDVAAAMGFGLSRSRMCFTAVVDDDAIAMFGVAPDGEGNGIVWMVATNAMERLAVKKELLRASREFLPLLMQGYSRVYNVVDQRNDKAIRWLHWLGFEFENAVNVNGYPFLPFWKVNHV